MSRVEPANLISDMRGGMYAIDYNLTTPIVAGCSSRGDGFEGDQRSGFFVEKIGILLTILFSTPEESARAAP